MYNVLLPLIATIPTGSMVLAAGMGQLIDELDMSMGILAGSTIGHVSVWWFLTVFWGRVTVEHGDAMVNGSMDPTPRYRSHSHFSLSFNSNNYLDLVLTLILPLYHSNYQSPPPPLLNGSLGHPN